MLSKWFLSHSLVVGIIKTPKFHPFIQHFSFPFSPSTFCSTASESESESDTHPFAVSYLINNFGFSTQSALKAFNQKEVLFKSPDKPNSVLTFFKNHEFSDSNIRTIIRKQPWLLSAKPHQRLLPKFQFFLSKGVSSSDIVSLLTAYPRILQFSLEKRIIPLFELLSRFFKTNKDVIVCLIQNSMAIGCNPYHLIVANINLMTDFGFCDTNIARLLQTRPSIFGSNDLIKSLEEVKGLGFNPSMTTFVVALMAKKCMTKKLWNQKVDVFKKWGWSDEDVLEAFKRQPQCMLTSIDKINAVMSFWVNQLGWDATAIVKQPGVFGSSLERRIEPRATVLQYLLKNGLLKNKASITIPILVTDKLFLERYINRYKEESSYLLKLYAEKLNVAHARDKIDMI
jgi:mTERF domain-containing protein